jgi:adenosine kinase
MSVVSSSFEKNHGGTGANIAYNLALLWERAILLSSIWEDYQFSWIISEKVNLSYVHKQSMSHSANSIIISDNQDNRMTFFHPWAMQYASSSKVEYVQETCSIWIVSANHIPTMIEHAKWLSHKKIPFFIDPSQQISQLNRKDLDILLGLGTHLVANHNEFSQILAKTTKTESEILSMFDIVIVTHWAEGLHLFQDGTMIHIPAIQVAEFDDTTWAGDALRAWILYGITEWRDIKTSCQLGTILASYCILAPGSQQHHFSLWSVMEDMKTHFGVEMDLFNKRKY